MPFERGKIRKLFIQIYFKGVSDSRRDFKKSKLLSSISCFTHDDETSKLNQLQSYGSSHNKMAKPSILVDL